MGLYQPGSFTKNFGWDRAGPGLSKLYRSIQRGFSGELRRVERGDFRQKSQVRDSDRQLIPINFFLANEPDGGSNYVAVDELVRQAVTQPHSPSFDMLALFALHLARVGHRPQITGHTHAGRYLGDFVRDVLWIDGGWKLSRLTEPTVEAYLQAHIAAEGDDTIAKCRTNYLFILEMAGIRASPRRHVSFATEPWIEAALFLAFDRYSIEAPPLLQPGADELLAALTADEAHKLLAMEVDELWRRAGLASAKYIASGGLHRL
jgi:hypothetical protein